MKKTRTTNARTFSGFAGIVGATVVALAAGAVMLSGCMENEVPNPPVPQTTTTVEARELPSVVTYLSATTTTAVTTTTETTTTVAAHGKLFDPPSSWVCYHVCEGKCVPLYDDDLSKDWYFVERDIIYVTGRRCGQYHEVAFQQEYSCLKAWLDDNDFKYLQQMS